MKLKFLKAEYGIDFKIPENFEEIFLKTFKNTKNNNIAMFSAVQFKPYQKNVLQLISKLGFTTITSKPFRASLEGQMLGCDSYKDSLKLDFEKIDGFLYIGDGYFHPNALLLAQEFEKEIKPVLIINIVQQIIEIIDKKHIEKYLKKRKAVFTKFYTSKTIGVFVTTKWGQEYMKTAETLPEKYPDKSFYFFIGDNFLDLEVENFPWVECFVNTACPRIGQDDILRHKKPVINIKDILK